jgi:hypothetical protein
MTTKATQQVWAHQLRAGDIIAMPHLDGDDLSVTIETVTRVIDHRTADDARVISFETTYRFPGGTEGTMHYRNKDRYEGYTLLNGPANARNVRRDRSTQAHKSFMAEVRS